MVIGDVEDSETCDLHFVSTPTGISSTITLTTIAHSLSPSLTFPMEYCLFYKAQMSVEFSERFGASCFSLGMLA